MRPCTLNKSALAEGPHFTTSITATHWLWAGKGPQTAHPPKAHTRPPSFVWLQGQSQHPFTYLLASFEADLKYATEASLAGGVTTRHVTGGAAKVTQDALRLRLPLQPGVHRGSASRFGCNVLFGSAYITIFGSVSRYYGRFCIITLWISVMYQCIMIWFPYLRSILLWLWCAIQISIVYLITIICKTDVNITSFIVTWNIPTYNDNEIKYK